MTLYPCATPGGISICQGRNAPTYNVFFSAEGARIAAQIHQHDLKQSGGGHPVIGLELVVMECLDDAGIVQRGGDLSGRGREIGDQSLAEARDFQKIASIVRPHGKRLDLYVRRSDPGWWAKESLCRCPVRQLEYRSRCRIPACPKRACAHRQFALLAVAATVDACFCLRYRAPGWRRATAIRTCRRRSTSHPDN